MFYKILMNGKEVWEGYRIFNIESAKATAKIWREQHYDYKTRTYPKMQVVPQIPEIIGRAIMQIEAEWRCRNNDNQGRGKTSQNSL